MTRITGRRSECLSNFCPISSNRENLSHSTFFGHKWRLWLPQVWCVPLPASVTSSVTSRPGSGTSNSQLGFPVASENEGCLWPFKGVTALIEGFSSLNKAKIVIFESIAIRLEVAILPGCLLFFCFQVASEI